MIEFQAWPKIARLNRDITITEKIDGTNAAVGVVATPGVNAVAEGATWVPGETGGYLVYAQSRKNLITPERDNHGFARWVWDNAEALATVLGPGLHYGEWWGAGIQRGYGLPKGEKRFSLFNTKRWSGTDHTGWPRGLCVVPVLYEGPFMRDLEDGDLPPWLDALDDLAMFGSEAAPGFMRPEGIVIYHHAANSMFKVTLEGDEAPKSLAA